MLLSLWRLRKTYVPCQRIEISFFTSIITLDDDEEPRVWKKTTAHQLLFVWFFLKVFELATQFCTRRLVLPRLTQEVNDLAEVEVEHDVGPDKKEYAV